MKHLITLLLACVVTSCAAWQPVAKTINETARIICIEAFGESQTGMSAEDWCAVHENLYPFIKAVTGAREGAAGGSAQ